MMDEPNYEWPGLPGVLCLIDNILIVRAFKASMTLNWRQLCSAVMAEDSGGHTQSQLMQDSSKQYLISVT